MSAGIVDFIDEAWKKVGSDIAVRTRALAGLGEVLLALLSPSAKALWGRSTVGPSHSRKSPALLAGLLDMQMIEAAPLLS